MPTLIRHYLRFNASILSFNVDPDFSDVVDSLMRVDLRQTDRRILKRFMGREGFAGFKERFGLLDDDTGRDVAKRRARAIIT